MRACSLGAQEVPVGRVVCKASSEPKENKRAFYGDKLENNKKTGASKKAQLVKALGREASQPGLEPGPRVEEGANGQPFSSGCHVPIMGTTAVIVVIIIPVIENIVNCTFSLVLVHSIICFFTHHI